MKSGEGDLVSDGRGRLHLGIVCFPTFGGSGVVASEIALAMAARGHCVHVFARDVPVRIHAAASHDPHPHPHPDAHVHASVAGGSGAVARGVKFHEVSEGDAGPPQSNAYPIALAAKLVEVATYARIDIIHAHYAAPHTTAAWMAREALRSIAKAPRVITTLHGTDVTAADASHLPITRHAVVESDACTTPSTFLEREAHAVYGPSLAIDVIANFVDTARYAPLSAEERAHARAGDTDLVLVHVSNFRKVKRVHDVVAVFAAATRLLHGKRGVRLVMVGDGPERSSAERRVRELGLSERVTFLGKQEAFVDVLAAADVFLLPSESESFGLAALEAMSCGIPVVASDVGGVPEVVANGVTGLLARVGDVDAMAAHVVTLANEATWLGFSQAARKRVLAQFRREPAIDSYEALYRRVLKEKS